MTLMNEPAHMNAWKDFAKEQDPARAQGAALVRVKQAKWLITYSLGRTSKQMV